jgi:hypothetical protein
MADGVTELCVWNHALRRTRNIELAVRDFLEMLPQSVDHQGIAWEAVSILSRRCSPRKPKAEIANEREYQWVHTETSVVFYIKVESIHDHLVKRTGIAGLDPVIIHRTKRAPEEISKFQSRLLTKDFLVRWICAAEGEQDLLASVLANRDIIDDLLAAREQLCLRPVDGVCQAITLVPEVGPRVAIPLVRKDIDEPNIDDIQRCLLAEVAQALLIGALALVKILVFALSRGAGLIVPSTRRHWSTTKQPWLRESTSRERPPF